ncbi:FGGY family carbohydrate kinase, partial [Rikenella microfusus]
RVHVTDASNASRTMLFNIHTLEWDKELLALFDIPESMLPEVRDSSEIYCDTATTLFSTKIPISGIAGDQQAALFGQLCTEPGMVKTTYGTGCFMMTNTGDKPVVSKNNLLTTVAWRIAGRATYALEGSVFVGGAVVQWLRDALHVVGSSAETEKLAVSVPDNGGVYFVPALTGLGAPYWDQYARGTIVGITRGTTAAHLARAALEGVAYEVYDIMGAMAGDVGALSKEMRVDGGAVANDFLMQFQADICRGEVLRPVVLESTAMGAAFLAGLAVGYWRDIADLQKIWKLDRAFGPSISEEKAEKLLHDWHRAVKRSEGWVEES